MTVDAQRYNPRFTVLVPVVRPPDLLKFAIRSICWQTRQDFEAFIICDGAPAATVEFAERLASEDLRFKVFVHEKGDRNGEAWRDAALRTASGEIVCHLADDDLWLPIHLETMDYVLQRHDLGNSLHLALLPDGKGVIHFKNTANTLVQQGMMRENYFNNFGLSAGAYRLDAYRKLPEGWSPAPQGMYTDLHMWRKFLADPDLSCGTCFKITMLALSSLARKEVSIGERAAEHETIVERIQEKGWLDAVIDQALAEKADRLTRLEAEVTTSYERLRSAESAHEVALERARSELETARSELETARSELETARSDIQSLNGEINRMKSSRSWKMTKPVRDLLTGVRRIRRRIDHPSSE